MAENLPGITVDELKRAMAADGTPRTTKLNGEEVLEYAIAALHMLRGVRRADKKRVLDKARTLLK